jgi:hypothetical protein
MSAPGPNAKGRYKDQVSVSIVLTGSVVVSTEVRGELLEVSPGVYELLVSASTSGSEQAGEFAYHAVVIDPTGLVKENPIAVSVVDHRIAVALPGEMVEMYAWEPDMTRAKLAQWAKKHMPRIVDGKVK